MRCHPCLFFASSILIISASASNPSCGQACEVALSYLNFNGTDAAAIDDSKAQCNNILRVQSVFLCMRSYCTPQDVKAGLLEFNKTCKEDGGFSLPLYSSINNMTKHTIETLRNIDVTNYTSTEKLNTAVSTSQDLYQLAKHTVDTENHSEVVRVYYGYAVFAYWGFVLLIGFVSRLSGVIESALDKRLASSAQFSKYKALARLPLWIKCRLTTPALLKRRTTEPFGWMKVPPRLQSLTVAAFVLINVALCCITYDPFEGNLYWPRETTQILHYVAARTGILAIANFPLLWTFAMRNNVLLWLTGWSFATFNMFHRWVARVATVEAILHSVAFTAEGFLDGGAAEYYSDWNSQYWWCGVIGCIAMSFLCAVSVYPVRRYLYEAFLIIHIALAILLIVTLWYHVKIFNGKYNLCVWPCVAVWAVDRVIRIGRLVFLNTTRQMSTASYNPETDVVRLSIPAPNMLRPRPGTYYYVYILHGMKFWESHPFTLSSWTEAPEHNAHDFEKTDTSDKKSLSFIMKPYSSFTDRLRNSILHSETKSGGDGSDAASFRVLIEGPYGHHLDLEAYDSLLFVVGGTGITVALSHLCSLFHAARRRDENFATTTVRIFWSVRDISLFYDVYDRELARWFALPQLRDRVRLELHVSVTGWRRSRHGRSASLNKAIGTQDIRLTTAITGARMFTQMFPQRPNVLEVVRATVEKHFVGGGGGRLAVVSCGPARMDDDARFAVVEMLANGYDKVDYYPESFTW